MLLPRNNVEHARMTPCSARYFEHNFMRHLRYKGNMKQNSHPSPLLLHAVTHHRHQSRQKRKKKRMRKGEGKRKRERESERSNERDRLKSLIVRGSEKEVRPIREGFISEGNTRRSNENPHTSRVSFRTELNIRVLANHRLAFKRDNDSTCDRSKRSSSF